ncbi:MAG TPA: GDP-mannose 4,6-dehydratase, partial [Acidobacteriota bacterium]|nr:GDP-mannose 4,6-dehydratase [Acidobacteriota bacterium]
GPRMWEKDGRVVSNFIVQALTCKPLTVYGDGKQTRSFCYVSDLVRGLKMMMETPGITGPINLGNPEEFTMIELAELIREMTGTSSPIKFEPLPQDDPVRRRPDISLAKQLLGWEPAVPLREGLKLTIDYFDRLLSNRYAEASADR